jgi:hypothetical protein
MADRIDKEIHTIEMTEIIDTEYIIEAMFAERDPLEISTIYSKYIYSERVLCHLYFPRVRCIMQLVYGYNVGGYKGRFEMIRKEQKNVINLLSGVTQKSVYSDKKAHKIKDYINLIDDFTPIFTEILIVLREKVLKGLQADNNNSYETIKVEMYAFDNLANASISLWKILAMNKLMSLPEQEEDHGFLLEFTHLFYEATDMSRVYKRTGKFT